MDVTSTVTKSPSPDSESNSVVSAQPTSFIPFQTGPSLDDVLLEVVSYLPTHFSTFNNRPERILIHPMYVILCTTPARTPILRALSQTSRLLRSRCLPLVWQRTAFWGPNFGRLDASFDEAIGKRNYSSLHVLKACPYLLPLIRTVSVMLTTYQKAEIIPAFADCLATLPNLNTTQIINTGWETQTDVKRFPSVRRISLPSFAHEIIRGCPNLEEVTCVDGDGRDRGSIIWGHVLVLFVQMFQRDVTADSYYTTLHLQRTLSYTNMPTRSVGRMMTRAASKRAKMDVTSVTRSPSLDLGSDGVVSTQPPPFIPFQTGPSLERIPDDVLLEVVSHLPTIDDSLRSYYDSLRHPKYVIPSAMTARTPTLRALSKTSRLLRSRCLVIAWRNVALCGINLWKQKLFFEEALGKVTEDGMRVLNACPYLLPLIQTVSVILVTHQKAKIIPELAACLATIPNFNTIQVIYTDFRMQTAIKNAFRGKRFPSVRRISLPSCAHEIIKRCPNLEEVICVDEDGNKIIQSIVEGKCHQVRILKGISAPLTRLVDLVPNLTHASVAMGSDMTPLTNFPFLGTIEILIDCDINVDLPLSEFAALDIGRAREILKGNKSQAEKTVVLTKSNNLWDYRAYQFDVGQMYTITEAVKV